MFTMNKGADPDVVRYIVVKMRKFVPYRGDFHHAEGDSDAHIKSSMFGCDQMIIVERGELKLGTWQKITSTSLTGRSHKLWALWLPGI